MTAILNLVGPVAIPAGATDGDVIFRHIGVVRGGALVAGGSFLGKVNVVSGELKGLDGQPVSVPVLQPGDLTDTHPYLEVNISWRGQGVGYSFLVDLFAPAGATSLDIRNVVAGKPVALAEQVTDLLALIRRGEAMFAQGGTPNAPLPSEIGLQTVKTDGVTVIGNGVSLPLSISGLGAKNGIATLDADGKVPVGQLPTLQISTPAFNPTLIAIGDSITAGYMSGAGTQDYGSSAWPAIVGQIRGWAVSNYGIDGSELVSGGSSGANPMVERVSSAVPSGFAGHVALAGGTNDYNTNRPLGAPGSTDTSTIYGALLTIGRGILTKAPACLLHLITPLYRADSGHTDGTYNAAGYTLEMVRQAVRDVAAQLEREYPGHIQLHDAGRELHDWLAKPGNIYMAADNLHLSAAGEALLGQHLAMQMLGASGTATSGTTTPPDGSGTGTTMPTNALYSRVFADLAAGSLSGQDGWTAYGNAQATISSNGLSLSAPFDSNPRGVLHTLPSGATRVQARFVAPTNYGNGVMLRAVHQLSDDAALCAWVITNGNGSPVLDWGIIQGSSVTSWIGAYGPGVPADCMLEIALNGGTAELRYWGAVGTRPDAAQYTHVTPNLTPDAFGFGTIGSDTQVIKSIVVTA